MRDTQPSRYERRQAIGLFVGLVAFVFWMLFGAPTVVINTDCRYGWRTIRMGDKEE